MSISRPLSTTQLVVQCGDRYPLAEIPGTCAPCVCDDGVLKDCRYHAMLKDPILWINGRGVTGVEESAFEANGGTITIHLEDNEIETLPVGVFDPLQNPVWVRVQKPKLAVLISFKFFIQL